MSEHTNDPTNTPAGTPNRSHLYLRVEEKLRQHWDDPGASLEQYIRERRDQDKMTFEAIALELSGITGIRLNHETPRRWYRATEPHTGGQSAAAA